MNVIQNLLQKLMPIVQLDQIQQSQFIVLFGQKKNFCKFFIFFFLKFEFFRTYFGNNEIISNEEEEQIDDIGIVNFMYFFLFLKN